LNIELSRNWLTTRARRADVEGEAAGIVAAGIVTAVRFLLYGAAICLRARLPLSHRAFRFSVVIVGLGTMVALLLLTLGCLNRHHWPFNNPAKANWQRGENSRLLPPCP
jgi:hypothetical protein